MAALPGAQRSSCCVSHWRSHTLSSREDSSVSGCHFWHVHPIWGQVCPHSMRSVSVLRGALQTVVQFAGTSSLCQTNLTHCVACRFRSTLVVSLSLRALSSGPSCRNPQVRRISSCVGRKMAGTCASGSEWLGDGGPVIRSRSGCGCFPRRSSHGSAAAESTKARPVDVALIPCM